MNVIYVDGYKKVDMHKLRIDVLNEVPGIFYNVVFQKTSAALRGKDNANFDQQLHRFRQSFANHMLKLMRSESEVSTKFLNEAFPKRNFIRYSGTLYELVACVGYGHPEATHKYAFVHTSTKRSFYNVNPIPNDIYEQLLNAVPMNFQKIDLIKYGLID